MLGLNMGKPPKPRDATPKSAEDVLLAYESLLATTQAMLGQAREGNWDALVEGGARYVVDVEALGRLAEGVHFDESQRAQQADLLEAILDNDVRIRRYLIARRDKLGEMIDASQRRRDLNRAYPGGQSATPELDGPADED